MKNKILLILTLSVVGLLTACSSGNGVTTDTDSAWTIDSSSMERGVAIMARRNFLIHGAPTSLADASMTPADFLASIANGVYDTLVENCRPSWRKSGTLFWVDEDDINNRVYEVMDREEGAPNNPDTARVYNPYTGGTNVFTQSEDVTYTCVGSLLDAETHLDDKYALPNGTEAERLAAVRDVALDQLARVLGSTQEERNAADFLENNASHIGYKTSCEPEEQHFSWLVLPDSEVADVLSTSLLTNHTVAIVPSPITEWATYGYSVDLPISIDQGVAYPLNDTKFLQSGRHTCVFIK